jgi:serine/threonine-protein kinase
MERVNGMDLHRRVDRFGPLVPGEAISFIRQAAVGLQHAHEQGFYHRDIKPSNLMARPACGGEAVLKILDWGIAGWNDPRDARFSRDLYDLTRPGSYLGTPNYVAPEQAENPRAADIRSDVYGLGATLYFLLTGRVATPETITALQEHPGAINAALNPSGATPAPEVSPEVSALICRMMAPTPSRRPQTPAEVLEELARVRSV